MATLEDLDDLDDAPDAEVEETENQIIDQTASFSLASVYINGAASL